MVDDPPSSLVFVHLDDRNAEFGLVFEAIAVPELGDLAYDLLTVGVAFAPFHRWMKAVQEAMNLEARRVVHFLSESLARCKLQWQRGCSENVRSRFRLVICDRQPRISGRRSHDRHNARLQTLQLDLLQPLQFWVGEALLREEVGLGRRSCLGATARSDRGKGSGW